MSRLCDSKVLKLRKCSRYTSLKLEDDYIAKVLKEMQASEMATIHRDAWFTDDGQIFLNLFAERDREDIISYFQDKVK